MNRCVVCNLEAQYIVDGSSVCRDHKENKGDKQQETRTAGERLTGGY